MPQLVVPSFGGGVVLQGSPDTKKTDELAACASFDLGERGQLIAAGKAEAFATIGTVAWAQNLGVFAAQAPTGESAIATNGASVVAVGRTTPTAITTEYTIAGGEATKGWQVTVASVPYQATAGTGTPSNPVLINISHREKMGNTAPFNSHGLWVLGAGGSPSAVQLLRIDKFDALGTGLYSESFAGGTKGKPLTFRGIVGYNNHIFGWGSFNTDDTTLANRLAFSNAGIPLKWGNDNKNASGNRDYTDSDAITIGAAGDFIRCCYAWNSRLYIGTDKELHWLQGYGRQSFITDGSNVQARENVLGPHCMTEGPDGLLYGVGSNGLWAFDGSQVDVVGRRVVDFGGKSNGWWDLIWYDSALPIADYPGRTNADLVWMMNDRAAKQVWVVIPFCNATLGYGVGTDTVIIKYHVLTGGFTRQVFTGVTYTHGCYLGTDGSGAEVRLLGATSASAGVVHRYGFKADASVSPAIASPLPSATFGPYAPYGPHGTGVHRVCYLTLGWESASSLPLVFTVTPSVDDQSGSAMKVSIQPTTPASPADGDYWLDTSGTDTNEGVATGTTLVPAAADYVWKTYSSSRARWIVLPHGGQKGTRATLRLAYRAMRGTRVTLAYVTTSAAGRFQIESLGLEPAAAREAA